VVEGERARLGRRHPHAFPRRLGEVGHEREVPHREDAAARVPVRGRVAGELLEVVAVDGQPDLDELAAGRVEEVLAPAHEAAGQGALAGERRCGPLAQQHAQDTVPHREHDQVHRHGEQVAAHGPPDFSSG
jgi:hypothetical protein